MPFQSEKDSVIVTELDKFYDDLQLVISTDVYIKDELTLENCDVIIDLAKGGIVKGNNSALRMIDCNIVFIGWSDGSAFELNNCYLQMDNCVVCQEEIHKETFTVFFGVLGNRFVELDRCEFMNMDGRVFQLQGASLFMDDCSIINLNGEFCSVVCQDDGDNEYFPSVNVLNSTFENCATVSKDILKEKKHTSKDDYNYAMHGENDAELIMCEDNNYVKIENVLFKNCSLRCLRVDAYWGKTPRGAILNCRFKKCHQLNADSDYPYTCFFRFINLQMDNCVFESIDGVYSHCKYVPTRISNCVFKSCGSRKIKAYQEGVLYIFNEVGRKIIDIIDCKFIRCKLKGEFENVDNDNGVIIIRAGAPDRDQRKTVLIKGCIFDDCDCEKNINGKEKQDGFFGSTITFYREES